MAASKFTNRKLKKKKEEEDMGRAKLKMKLIEKEKARKLTLKKRSEGLTKKMHELTTLCGVSGCMIIYDPAQCSPSIWPSKSDDEVRRLIEAYKSKSGGGGGVKAYGLSEFFDDREKEVKGELCKLRKQNLEAKYPTWDDRLCFLDEIQLRGLGAALQFKAQNVRSRIQALKSEIFVRMVAVNSSNSMGYQMCDVEQGFVSNFDAMQMNFQIPMNHEMMMNGMQNYHYAAPAAGMQNYHYAAPPPPPQQDWEFHEVASRQYERQNMFPNLYN